MYAGVLLATLLVGVEPTAVSSAAVRPQAVARSGATQRPYHEIDKQITQLLVQEAVQAKQKDEVARSATIRTLCAVHREVVGDARYATSDTLQAYQSKLSSRLTRAKKDLAKSVAGTKSAGAGSNAGEKRAAEIANAAEQLATQESLSATLLLADYSLGSPNLYLAQGGAAVAEANGQALVDLIETTINPQFWDTAGGKGTIRYYAPLQCLVIRATGEVHENVGGLVGDLRAAEK